MDRQRFGVVRSALMAFASMAAISGAALAEDVLPRLREIHQLVMDPARTFSISATLAELEALELRLANAPPDDVARGELSYLRGFVLYRAGKTSESLAPTREALRIEAIRSFLPMRERARAIYRLASQAEELGLWALAIENYKQVIPLFSVDEAVSWDRRLGVRERLAFCLHQARRFAEARDLNREVLAGGQRLFGPDSEKLLVVITNLAQNSYELGDFPSARAFLERRLSIATKHDDSARAEDSLFQLGVLTFEQGERQEAETLMRRRLALAEKSGNQGRIASAKEDLDILHQKLGR